MAGNTATLTLKILADVKDAQKGLSDAEGSAGKFSAGVKGAAVPAAAALAGLAVAGIDMAKSAAEDAAAADQLALALKNSAGASDSSIAATETWITNTSKAAAVADDELRPALATLVRATGDVATSQDAMGVALDVSAATGKDVESVSTALAKAYGGQTAGLKKLVPGMDDAILASGDMDAIMAELARTTGGAAAEAANGAAGQMKGMTIQMDEAKESIGAALLPAMSSLSGVLATVAGWVQENSRLFLIIGGVIGGIASAILILNVAFKAYAVITKAVAAATKVWTAVQWLWNAAMSANPLTIVIIAIVALIAAIVLIATKTTWFQDIWAAVWGFVTDITTKAWEAIKSAALAALNWIVSAWEAIKAAVKAVWDWILNAIQVVLNIIGSVIRGYIAIYVAIWNGIKTAVEAVWNWIKSAIDAVLSVIVGIIRGYIAIYVGIFEGIKAAVGAVWDGIRDAAGSALSAILTPIQAVERAFDRVVDAIRSVINWLGNIKVPDVLGKIGSVLDGINPFAATASASSGTVSTVNRAATFAAVPGLTAGASSSRGSAPTIVIQGALDPVAVARQIRDILKRDERRRSGVVIA